MGTKPAVYDPAVADRLAGSMRALAVLPEMFIYEIHCRDDRRRLSGPGYEYSWNLVMMRSGGYLQRLDGREDFYDATSAFVSRPGQERYAGHPAGPGDVSTGIWLGDRLVEDYFDGGARLPVGRITTSAGFDLAHRLLVAACRRGVDAPEAAERAYDLLARIEPAASAGRRRSPATQTAHRALAATTAEALATGYLAAGIEDLARLAACSPQHLSRVFRQVTGRSLTFYRNELRVRAVLGRLEAGDRSLRTLAAEYGFADQAHLTRIVRRHLRTTPAALRDLLAGPEHAPRPVRP
ncbi:MAG: helix-turn-helix domain-containing protein [Streptosporangiaceae bacterium]